MAIFPETTNFNIYDSLPGRFDVLKPPSIISQYSKAFGKKYSAVNKNNNDVLKLIVLNGLTDAAFSEIIYAKFPQSKHHADTTIPKRFPPDFVGKPKEKKLSIDELLNKSLKVFERSIIELRPGRSFKELAGRALKGKTTNEEQREFEFFVAFLFPDAAENLRREFGINVSPIIKLNEWYLDYRFDLSLPFNRYDFEWDKLSFRTIFAEIETNYNFYHDNYEGLLRNENVP